LIANALAIVFTMTLPIDLARNWSFAQISGISRNSYVLWVVKPSSHSAISGGRDFILKIHYEWISTSIKSLNPTTSLKLRGCGLSLTSFEFLPCP
jgi:hypothetical protein